MLTLFAWIETHWSLGIVIAFGIDALVVAALLLCALIENENAACGTPGRRRTPFGESHGLMASGRWKGRYEQYGSSHCVLEFGLHVHANGIIIGSGRDDVGAYELRGFLKPCVQIASAHASSSLADVRLVKYYRCNTGNPNENFGHFVHYAGALVQMGSGEGGGVELSGTWHVDVLCGYSGSGNFNLKPVRAQTYEPPSVPMVMGTAVM